MGTSYFDITPEFVHIGHFGCMDGNFEMLSGSIVLCKNNLMLQFSFDSSCFVNYKTNLSRGYPLCFKSISHFLM